MSTIVSFQTPIIALALAPLLPGIINRTKAFFGGRKGPPLLQLYYDLFKLLKKSPTYSTTTTWVFRAGPVIGLSAVIVALFLTPLGDIPAVLAFPGDIILICYLLGLARFFTIAAALDTGSAFEGMGASREAQFSILTEIALFVTMTVLILQTDSWSLSTIFGAVLSGHSLQSGAIYIIVVLVLAVLFLAENARIPVDDPTTHLELTMIHEVMVLDHSGPDLALIEYGSALKMWIMGSLIVGVANPLRLTAVDTVARSWHVSLIVSVLTLFLLAVGTGIVESCMARLRLQTVPRLITGAAMLAAIALTLSLR